MSSSRKGRSKKASSNADKLYDDFPFSVGFIHPDVRGSYPDLYSDFVKTSKSNKKQVEYQRTVSKSKGSQSTRRVTRSSSKFRELSSSEDGTEDYFDSLDWYSSNKQKHDGKLKSVLDDFQYSESSDSRKGKQYYNYLLLDSRRLAGKESWSDFSNSVIYVGKGKDKRAYDHTKRAAKIWNEGGKADKKTDRIHEVWKDGGEVVVLKVADNLAEEEALTREALIIEAMGKQRLCNIKSGTFYGSASLMKPREKRELGANLLVKARQQLHEDGGDRVSPPGRY